MADYWQLKKHLSKREELEMSPLGGEANTSRVKSDQQNNNHQDNRSGMRSTVNETDNSIKQELPDVASKVTHGNRSGMRSTVNETDTSAKQELPDAASKILKDGETLGERHVLRNVFVNFFKKYKDTPPEDIPKDEITRWHDFLENELSKGTTKEGHEEEQPRNEERISMTAQLFNTSDTKPAKSFLKELQKTLGTLDIKANVLREFGEADQAKVLIIVFNKNVSENWQAVDKCLSHIEECQYRRIIFIILHVTRKPPRTSVRNLLKSSDFPEQYRTIGRVVIMAFLLEKGIYACDVNDLAFKEIKEFCSKFCSIKSAENEIKGRPSENMAETCSSVANIIEGKDILKPLAYITNPTDTVASNNFTYKLKEEMKTHDIVLSEIQPVEASQIDSDVFLVLVCNNNSRIETDVDRCLAFISNKQYNKTILIVLNIVNKERKPKDFGQYQDIFRIIEMSFTNEKGIYACEMNEKACSELIELFKTHGNTGAVKTNMEGEESPNNTDSCSGKSLDESQKIENAVPVKKKKSDPTE